MDAIKPQYSKVPINSKNTNYSCLSWINDSTGHREDIMQRQQRKNNEQRYEPRWS